jgi:hypothetical protein
LGQIGVLEGIDVQESIDAKHFIVQKIIMLTSPKEAQREEVGRTEG